ncbi:MAG: DUF2550 domain-containing protein [Propionibacteriaceae bacterium]|jgi:hypothetical protein|nr:DUF2550 domain-containing protein [Propionibacteriaceae bacterium]
MEVGAGIEIVVIVLCALLGSAVLWLVFRRSHLGAGPGTFECYLRPGRSDFSRRWAHGVARYQGDALLWFPLVSLSLRPRLRLRRLQIEVGPQRWPTSNERSLLFEGQQIVQLTGRQSEAATCELAMSPSAVTGLLAWAESAPPGQGQYGHTWSQGDGA